MPKNRFLITTLILIAVSVSSWLWLFPGITNQAPNISFKIIDGSKIDLKTLQGQPILVTFWATSCKSCAKEMPHLFALYNDLAPSGFEIIGVAMAYDPPNLVVRMAKQKQIPYPIALDIDGKIAKAFGNVSNTPTSFLIAPDGTIIKQQIGTMDIEILRQQIMALLAKQAQGKDQQST